MLLSILHIYVFIFICMNKMTLAGHGIPPQHFLGLKAQVLSNSIVKPRELQARSANCMLES